MVAFLQEQNFIFIVGTEEGIIHKCSTAHRSGYLLSYVGHDMAVYSVQWNKVDPTIFLSSSADWSVNLWHTDSPTVSQYFLICQCLPVKQGIGFFLEDWDPIAQ